MTSQTRAILVTGGAGYIGSHVTLALRDAQLPVVVLDDLSTGSRDALFDDVAFIEGSTGDRALVADVLRSYRIGAVLHFAGSLVVPESIDRPLRYWQNNLCNTLGLAESCVQAGVRQMVFSSTAAVYSASAGSLVDEDATLAPATPYGSSKLAAERMLADVGAAHGLRSVVLRYFNVAGGDAEGRAGQRGTGATHLIKAACEVAAGRRAVLPVYGDDYATPDGTCVRDFIHVSDLAEAHLLALGYLQRDGSSTTLNCGYGVGHSVRSVIEAVEAEVGAPLAIRQAGRRPGDLSMLVARADKIRRVLDWRPRRTELRQIVASSLAWERRLLEQRRVVPEEQQVLLG